MERKHWPATVSCSAVLCDNDMTKINSYKSIHVSCYSSGNALSLEKALTQLDSQSLTESIRWDQQRQR